MIETVIWLLISVAALGASGVLAHVYYRAWQRIRRSARLPIGEPLRIPAWANLRRELLRVIAQSLFLMVGVLSIYQLINGQLEHGRLISITLLLLGQLSMAANSWADWRDDGRLIAAVDEWDQRYVAVPKDQPPTVAQMDRVEATGEDVLRRLKRSAIGDREQAIVDQEQADRIEATGEESADRLRRGGIGDEP